MSIPKYAYALMFAVTTTAGGLFACGAEVNVAPSSSSAATGGTSNVGGMGSTAGTGGLSASQSSASVSSTTSSNASAGGGPPNTCTPLGDGQYIPKPCPLLCEVGGYCQYRHPFCGNFDKNPKCQPLPASCPDRGGMPTCGCDGVLYDNACKAAAAGTSPSALHNCPAPPGYFPCGPHYCPIGTTVCYIATPEGPPPAYYECRPIPSECLATPNCDCVKANDAMLNGLPCTECFEGALLFEMHAP